MIPRRRYGERIFRISIYGPSYFRSYLFYSMDFRDTFTLARIITSLPVFSTPCSLQVVPSWCHLTVYVHPIQARPSPCAGSPRVEPSAPMTSCVTRGTEGVGPRRVSGPSSGLRRFSPTVYLDPSPWTLFPVSVIRPVGSVELGGVRSWLEVYRPS